MRPAATLGAIYLGAGRCRFRVWAPAAHRVDVRIVEPRGRVVPLEPRDGGYHEAVVEDAEPGATYLYRLDGAEERPDPASRFQPQGVHGPSAVVDPAFPWTDASWRGIALSDHVFYELHVGAYTSEGTFDALIPHLDYLRDLGVTAVEIMPVSQFPGSRNWGYDGVYPFAPQDSYGGPGGLRRLVNACHERGLALVLDVVHNHLGPEGNYLGDFAPYFTDRYRTPWGLALNFDGPHNDHVRRFFVESALHWIHEYHVDGFRLDAVHAILDHSPVPFLEELAEAVHGAAEGLGRRVHLIAETGANDPRVVRSPPLGGYGLDAQWNDDFHHSLHALLTGERTGYYQDYGRPAHLAKALRNGYVYTGEYSAYHRRPHGARAGDLPAHRLVVGAQNHDQVGNRARGERLGALVSFEAVKLAAGLTILSPYVPLLFMGEEYGENAPFLYFTSHSDAELAEAVRRGRREEFASFLGQAEVPDPQNEATFLQSRLRHDLKARPEHGRLLEFYRLLLRLRREIPALRNLCKDDMEVRFGERQCAMLVRRWAEDCEVAVATHYGSNLVEVTVALPSGRWRKVLDSAEVRWDGPGSAIPRTIMSEGEVVLSLKPWSIALLEREGP